MQCTSPAMVLLDDSKSRLMSEPRPWEMLKPFAWYLQIHRCSRPAQVCTLVLAELGSLQLQAP